MSTPLPDCPDQPDLPFCGDAAAVRSASSSPVQQAPLAAYHGRRVNLSALARLSGVSYQTVRRRLLALEQTGFLRLLRPLGEGAGKRAAPVLYLRNLRLLGELSAEQRYRTRLVEAIAALAEGAEPEGAEPEGAEPEGAERGGHIGYLHRPHGGIVEPVVEVAGPEGTALVGFAFCAAALPRRRMWTALTRAQRLGLLRQGFVLYPGSRAFFSAGKVVVVPDAAFLGGYAEWMAAALDPSPRGLQQLMRRCNDPGRLTLSPPGG